MKDTYSINERSVTRWSLFIDGVCPDDTVRDVVDKARRIVDKETHRVGYDAYVSDRMMVPGYREDIGHTVVVNVIPDNTDDPFAVTFRDHENITHNDLDSIRMDEFVESESWVYE